MNPYQQNLNQEPTQAQRQPLQQQSMHQQGQGRTTTPMSDTGYAQEECPHCGHILAKDVMRSHDKEEAMKAPMMDQPRTTVGTQMQGQAVGFGGPKTILVRREHKEKRTSIRDPCISLVSVQDLGPFITSLNPTLKQISTHKEKEKEKDKHPLEFKMTDDGYYEVELQESMQEHFQDLVFLTILDKLGNSGYKYKYHYDQVAGTTNHKREVFVFQQKHAFNRNRSPQA